MKLVLMKSESDKKTYNFLGSMPEGLIFTRSSSATYVNNLGVYVTALTDSPRISYDPNTLNPLGLSNEESRTNNVLQSRSFNTTWVKSAVTVAGSQESKWGDSSAYSITSTTTSNRLEQSITVSDAVTYTVSMIVKAGTLSVPQLRIDNNSKVYQVSYDTTTGIATSTGTTAPLSIFMTNLGGGFYRCAFSYLSGAASSIVRVYPNGAGSIILDYAGHENGTFPTSPILTTVSVATRAVEITYKVLSSKELALFSTSGTMVAKVNVPYPVPVHRAYTAALSDGTDLNLVGGFFEVGGVPTGGAVVGGAAPVLSGQTLDTLLLNETLKLATSYKVGANLFSARGLLDTAGAFGADGVPTITRIEFGNRMSGDRALNGYIAEVTLRQYTSTPETLTGA